MHLTSGRKHPELVTGLDGLRFRKTSEHCGQHDHGNRAVVLIGSVTVDDPED